MQTHTKPVELTLFGGKAVVVLHDQVLSINSPNRSIQFTQPVICDHSALIHALSTNPTHFFQLMEINQTTTQVPKKMTHFLFECHEKLIEMHHWNVHTTPTGPDIPHPLACYLEGK